MSKKANTIAVSSRPAGAGAALAGGPAVTRPLRVLQVIPQLGGGGTERALLTLLDTFAREVCQSKICVLSNLNTFPERTAGMDVEFFGYRGSLKDVRGMRDCVGRLRAAIEAFDADVVHSHLWPAARLSGLAIGRAGLPHVVHIQDTRPWLAGRSMRDWVTRRFTDWTVSRRARRYIAVSEAAKRYACDHLRIDASKVDVIPNGVLLSEFRPKANGESGADGIVRIGMVGLFKPEKGHRDLIAAARLLRGRGARVEVHFAGGGSLQSRCEAEVRESGLDGVVHFRGLVSNVETFLHEMDVFVLPSVFGEGLPLSILEAMACRLPVVATDVGGTREVIEDGVNGHLIGPGDVPALADSLAALCRDAALRQRLADAGLRTVEDRFSYDRIARQVEGVYQSVCHRE